MPSPVSIAAVLLLITGLTLSEVLIQEGTPKVNSPDGPIVGISLKSRDGRSFSSFKGIRYASIPGRFKSSIPVEPWLEPLQATDFGPKCPQIGLMDGAIDLGDEDCLYLNVYIPKVEPPELLPVMLWIHGGGFLDGAGSFMGPDYFMDENVILVTINYRLGAFGFLSTADDLVQGNNGLRDMVNSLKWVQKNIEAFGGDPAKVTIFGESAGGASVHLLMLSPAAKGLFRGVISQSGNALCPWALNTSPVRSARMLGAATNCSNTSPQELVECLKEKSVKAILEGMQGVMMNSQGSTGLAFSPTIEFKPSGRPEDFPIITDLPYNLLTKKSRNENSRDVPLIIGLNEMEGIALFASQFILSPEQLEKLDGNWIQMTAIPFFYEYYVPKEKKYEFGEKIRQYYFGDEPLTSENIQSLINLHTEFFLFRGSKLATELHAIAGAQVFPYLFKYRGEFSLANLMGLTDKGPTHADELQYLFPSLKTPQNWPNLKKGSADEDFSRKIIKLWASFATNGKPTECWGDAWSAGEAGVARGLAENPWMFIDKELKMVRDEDILNRINKLDVLYSEYEMPQVTWRAADGKMQAKDEL